MERLLAQLTEKLQAAFGGRLISVILYGSAAGGDYHPGHSDLNILCVLDRVTVEELEAGGEVFHWWRGQGNPSPLLLSEQEVRSCTDCFAVEFHDLQAQRKILHGRDVVAGLQLDDSFYRAQVEHDLRAKLLRLRQKAAGVLGEPEHLRRLLLDAVSTFCVLFRHALILRGEEAPLAKREIVAAAGRSFGIDTGPFTALLDVRERRIKPRDINAARLLDPLLAAVGAVIAGVDSLQK